MKDTSKTKQALTDEPASRKRKNRKLEQSTAGRKKAEKAQRGAESLYSLLFEHSPDGIVIIDPASMQIIAFNETVHRQLGYSRDEFARLSISDIDAIETPEETGTTIADVIKKGRKDFETRHRTRLGEIRDVHVTAQSIEFLGKSVYHCVWRDITEHKRVEKELYKTNQTLQAIINASPLAIITLDRDLKVTNWSPAAERIFGWSREEVMGRYNPIVPVEKWDDFKVIASNVLSGVGYTRIEAWRQTKDGRLIFVNVSTAPLRGNQGQLVGVMGIIQDITDLKRAEEALRESEEKYQDLFNDIPDIIYSLDNMGNILTVNKHALLHYGYDKDFIIGKPFLNFTHPDDREIVAHSFSKAIEDRQEYTRGLQFRILARDGSSRWVECTSHMRFDGQGRYLRAEGVLRNITDHKQVEKTLQRQNMFLASLNETARDLMQHRDLTDLFQAIIARAMHFSETNEAWICIYDPQNDNFVYSAAIGRREYEIGSRIVSGRGINGEVLRTEQTVRIEDYHVWPKRAKLREYDMRRATLAIPLIREGRLAGILGLSHHDAAKHFEDDEVAMLERLAELASIALDNARLYDQLKLELTERKQAEEENLRLAERLQRSEKMEAIGNMAGGVAHDLNNVLGIVVGYAELLLNAVDEESPIKPRLLNIVSGGEKAAAIVQDMLTLSRRGIPSKQVMNLNNIIMEDQHSTEFEKLISFHPAIQMKIDLEPDLLNISGSPVHISKTLFNLVSNACEAMRNGGTLTIRTANRHLDKPVQGYNEVRQRDYVALSVSDTGEGIPAADLKRIFEPFYMKKIMGRSGTGLGLSVVWGMVEDHQGYVNVQSEEEKGSTFTLYFPVTREEIEVECTATGTSEYMGRGENILVVDDVQDQRNLASEMLRNLNYRVASVSSGEQAVAYVKKQPVDLMVLDMIMDPGMDGLDTYRSVLEICPKQKVLIVSGFAETERMSAAQALGAHVYIRKPYIMKRLGQAVRQELDRSA